MEYQRVELEEKVVVGVSRKLSNDDPEMPIKIGALWQKLYEGGIYNTVQNKVNDHAIGLYYNYSGADFKEYTTMAGVEVSKAENPELTTQVIPAGTYACFKLHGPMQTVVAQAWEAIWQMDLPRRFSGDFEEYLNDDMEAADIAIYIALQ